MVPFTKHHPYFSKMISSSRGRAPNLRRLEPKGDVYTDIRPSAIRMKNSFLHRSITMWNQLPSDLKTNDSYNSFKKGLKCHIKMHIEVHGDIIEH